MRKIIKYTYDLKLLFVEDEEDTRMATSLVLEEFFDKIIYAVDGSDGFKKFQENDIDLIITDINMPFMNGLEMINEIRKVDSFVPVLVLSAYLEPEYFIKSIDLNVKGYIPKPVDIYRFMEVIDNVIDNIKLKKEIDNKIRMQKNHLKSLQSTIDSVKDPILVIDKDYNVKLMNSVVRDNLYKTSIIDKDNPKCYEICHNLSSPCDEESFICPLEEVIRTNSQVTVIHEHYDLQYLHKKYVEIVANPQFDEYNNLIGIVQSSRDISTYIETQEKLNKQKEMLRHLATHDGLTGLANKDLFAKRLDESIKYADKNNKKFALFFVDLDNFKDINDTFGHKMGDYVIQSVAKSIKKLVAKDGKVFRIGGDEFTIIVNKFQDEQNLLQLAKNVLMSIKKPIENDGTIITSSASIGISIYPDDTNDGDTLIDYADKAMYKAKSSDEKIFFIDN